MTVEVPVGSTATVYVPGATDAVSAGVDASDLKKGFVAFETAEDGYARFTVRTGRYTFRVG